MMFSTTFWRSTGISTTVGMNMPQALLELEMWLRATLLTMPWERFFSAMVTPADWWCLRTPRLITLLTSLLMKREA